jgi:hypothetical protein
MKTTGSKDLKFVPKTTNPNDTMDVPFAIVGHKLRWVSGRASEDKFTRPWKVLRKSDLPLNIVEDLERRSINIFRDGETVRFGECVLAYATEEAVKVIRDQNRREAQSQLQSIGMNSEKRPGVSYDQKDTGVERMGSTEFQN